MSDGYPTPPNDQDPTILVGFLIPDSPEWRAIIRGALTELIEEGNWQKVGITIERATEIANLILYSYTEWVNV